MAQIGRIGGPLLADNLLRNGNNLAFETKLLYFDVANNRIGINTASPSVDLQTPTSLQTVNLQVNNNFEVQNNTLINGDTIYHYYGNLNFIPNQSSNPTINSSEQIAGSFDVFDNTIFVDDGTGNTDLNISPNGSGQTVFGSVPSPTNVLINGNLHATGNITWDGNITLGSAPIDTITITAEVNSNILPSTNNTYTLGSSVDPKISVGSVSLSSASSQFLSIAPYRTNPSTTALNLSARSSWTVEAWVYYDGTAPSGDILQKDEVIAVRVAQYGLRLDGNGYLQGRVGGGSSSQLILSSVPMTVNSWTHVALVLSSSTLSLYQNGARVASASLSVSLTDSGGYFTVGGTGNTLTTSVGTWSGYISNVRVVGGTAVYTGASFTPPSTVLTRISGTALLLIMSSNATLLQDGSINNFTVTNINSAVWSSSSPVPIPSLNWANLYANNFIVGSTSPNTINATTLNSGNLSITGTTITNTLSNSNLNFAPNGTGKVLVNGSSIQYVNGNNIVNPIAGADLIFSSYNSGASSGHYKISGKSGVGIPTGTSTQYPSNPEKGAFRYNIQLGYAEIYSGSVWQPAYGIAANATSQNVSDLSTLYSIVFGF